VGVADHGEQSLFPGLAVDDPVGVEDLVAAVLRVGLGEHHQLHVARVASELAEALHQVVDLVLSQRQAERPVGRHQRLAPTLEHIHAGERGGFGVAEQHLGLVQGLEHHFGHAVVDQRMNARGRAALQGAGQVQVIGDAALDPADVLQAAVAGDVGGLGGPGRECSRPGHHQEQPAFGLAGLGARSVGEQAVEHRALRPRQCPVAVGEVDVAGRDGTNRGDLFTQGVQQPLQAEGRERGTSGEQQHGILWDLATVATGRVK
jgi:hypothetical protein